MSKQDRTYTRTAADLERKYNLGRNAQGSSEVIIQGGSENNSEQVSKIAQELSEYKTTVNSKFQTVEQSIQSGKQMLKSHEENTGIHMAETEKNNLGAAYEHSKKTSGNPHNVTKTDIGLGNVDNTSDLNKPVSTAQQTAIEKSLEDANAYTDEKVAELLNNPTTDEIDLKFVYSQENESLLLSDGAETVTGGIGLEIVYNEENESLLLNNVVASNQPSILEQTLSQFIGNTNKNFLEVNSSIRIILEKLPI